MVCNVSLSVEPDVGRLTLLVTDEIPYTRHIIDIYKLSAN